MARPIPTWPKSNKTLEMQTTMAISSISAFIKTADCNMVKPKDLAQKPSVGDRSPWMFAFSVINQESKNGANKAKPNSASIVKGSH